MAKNQIEELKEGYEIARLLEGSRLTKQKLAEQLDISPTKLDDRFALTNLPREIQDRLRPGLQIGTGYVSVTVGRIIGKVTEVPRHQFLVPFLNEYPVGGKLEDINQCTSDELLSWYQCALCDCIVKNKLNTKKAQDLVDDVVSGRWNRTQETQVEYGHTIVSCGGITRDAKEKGSHQLGRSEVPDFPMTLEYASIESRRDREEREVSTPHQFLQLYSQGLFTWQLDGKSPPDDFPKLEAIKELLFR